MCVDCAWKEEELANQRFSTYAARMNKRRADSSFGEGRGSCASVQLANQTFSAT